MSEAQNESVNAFSKSHAVIATSSSCRTAFESPKGLSGICNARQQQPEPNQIPPLPPESSKTNEGRIGKHPNILPGKTLPKLNFYYRHVDYVCKRKQKKNKSFLQGYAYNFHGRISP